MVQKEPTELYSLMMIELFNLGFFALKFVYFMMGEHIGDDGNKKQLLSFVLSSSCFKWACSNGLCNKLFFLLSGVSQAESFTRRVCAQVVNVLIT